MASSSSTTNTATPPSSGGDEEAANPIGYCHSCDRQVEIDRELFTCTVCHGGFIELFEIPAGESAGGGGPAATAASDTDNTSDTNNMQHINIQISDGVS